jgi:uncharacterized protein CbrC (UPF0167 family)
MQNEKPVEEEQEKEIEVLEFSLTEKEINNLADELENLKKTKTNFTFPVDENNEFIIHYAGFIDDKDKKNLDDSDDEFYESEEGE